MRSMVEGYGQVALTLRAGFNRPCPSTTLRVVPLPMLGRSL
jgi:hypothetical protein